MHGINALFFIVEMFLNRNAFHLKHAATVVSIYVAMYTVWSLVHFALRIGIPPNRRALCNYEQLRDCPIYGVLDWHHPLET